MGKMSELDIAAHNAGLSIMQRRRLPLADIVRAVESTPLEAYPTDTTAFAMHLRGVVRLYVSTLQAAGMCDPLAQRLQLACIVQDLCDLVGEMAPPAVATYIG